jgi:hypothetical protein
LPGGKKSLVHPAWTNVMFLMDITGKTIGQSIEESTPIMISNCPKTSFAQLPEKHQATIIQYNDISAYFPLR